MTLLTQANNGLNLSPGQRAFLKALKGMVISAVLAGVTVAWPLVQQQNINWRTTLITAIVSVVFTLATALDKYWTSQGDAPLAAVAGSVAQGVAPPVPTVIQVPPHNTTVSVPTITITPTSGATSNI